MTDHSHAVLMLSLAQNDLRALNGMLDKTTFSDEIFGFHAQQTIEKSVKAWLSLAGVSYAKIHDLDELFADLERHGELMPERFKDLASFTDFAVLFRYEPFNIDAALDRREIIGRLTEFVDFVKTLIESRNPQAV